MAKLKTKRVKVWCRDKLTQYGYLGFYPRGHNKKAFKNTYTPSVIDGQKTVVVRKTVKGPKTKYARCPDCNRKLQLINKECQDAGCWHIYYPPHKKLIKP